MPANKWEQVGDMKWTRKFGPFEVRVYRSSIDQHYSSVCDVHDEDIDVRVPFSIFPDPYDDGVDEKALKMIEKHIKKVIRSWAK